MKYLIKYVAGFVTLAVLTVATVYISTVCINFNLGSKDFKGVILMALWDAAIVTIIMVLLDNLHKIVKNILASCDKLYKKSLDISKFYSIDNAKYLLTELKDYDLNELAYLYKRKYLMDDYVNINLLKLDNKKAIKISYDITFSDDYSLLNSDEAKIINNLKNDVFYENKSNYEKIYKEALLNHGLIERFNNRKAFLVYLIFFVIVTIPATLLIVPATHLIGNRFNTMYLFSIIYLFIFQMVLYIASLIGIKFFKELKKKNNQMYQRTNLGKEIDTRMYAFNLFNKNLGNKEKNELKKYPNYSIYNCIFHDDYKLEYDIYTALNNYMNIEHH